MRIKLKFMETLFGIFSRNKGTSMPLLIIKKKPNEEIFKVYNSIEDAIKELELMPNIPPDKIEKLRLSLKELKNKTSIKIIDGEIVK